MTRRGALSRGRSGATAALSGVTVALMVATGCRAKTDAANAATTPAVVQVGQENVTVVSLGDITVGPVISGTLTPQEQATLRAEVSGPVVQTYVDRGQAVKRGQLLARIDDTALREAFLSAQSMERSARVALDNAKRDQERSAALESAGAIAPRDVEATHRAMLAAEATLADAQSRLTTARTQLDKTTLRAPINGAVSDRPINAGDVVQPGTAIITVVDPSSMRLEASVPAASIGSVRLGQPVDFRVTGYGARAFTGRVQRINPTADPTTRQVRILVSIPNDKSQLVAGLFAQGQVASEIRRGILVPSSAVDQRGVTPVTTRVRDGKVERVPVQIGLIDSGTDRIEIRSGVAPGDTLLLGAAQGISVGTPVKVIITADSAATAVTR